jgi:protease Do-like 1, chloroplastic
MKARHFLLTLVLVVLSFIAGTAWKSDDSDSSKQHIARDAKTAKTVSFNEPDIEPPKGLSESELKTIELFENAAPSVVFITTLVVRRDYWSRNALEVPSGTGSGFVWSENGHVVTNYHVIRGSQKVQVTLANQTTYDAKVIGVAPGKDLAVLKIDAPKKILKPLAVGSSNDLLVGQNVYAIGNPFGLDQTLTTGVISALGREIESQARVPIRDVIQTDAAINPGNSGGPLLDSSGRLIGVNTQIYSPSGASAGIGFSIPVDAVRWVVPELIQYGKLRRPVIGVELVSQSNVRRYGMEGALIFNVTAGGPASKAGLMPTRRDRRGNIVFGDLITGLNTVSIKSNNDLILALEKYDAGDKVDVRVMRDKKELVIPVVLQSSEGN